MTSIDVRWLNREEHRDQVAGVAARSLRDNPGFAPVSDDPLERSALLFDIFGPLLDTPGALVAGALTGKLVVGVAGAHAPGTCVASMIPVEFLDLPEPGPDATAADRLLASGIGIARHDSPEDHWHVGPVGVEPNFQGQGIGRKVMELLCTELDERHGLAWLETDKPQNVRFYIALGFEIVEETTIIGATQWVMRRDPKS